MHQNNQIIIAVIGAAGAIVAAWITVKYRGRRTEQVTQNVVGGDKVAGDVIGGDKIEMHEHVQFVEPEREKKSTFVYFLEKVFVFTFTTAVCGGILGVIGFMLGKEVGAAIGGAFGLVAGFVNAGSVKRTKGIL